MEKEHIIENWIPLICKIVGKYTDERPVTDTDLYQECCMKFMRAAELFDPDKDIKFITYLYATINKTCWRWRKKEFSRRKKERAGIHYEDGNINEDLLAYDERILDKFAANEDADKFLAVLDNRSQYILRQRADGRTLEEIGTELSISRERVRQITELAYKKILAEFPY